MTDDDANLQLRSEVTADGRLRLTLDAAPPPEPGPGQVLVAMQAAPVNPSDVGLLLARADLSTLTGQGSGADVVVSAEIPADQLPALASRRGQPLTVGNEGAGEVVAAGPGAESLLGRTVALFGGSSYARYRVVDAASCLPLPEGARAADGASAFVNPLTVLGMVGTLHREGHSSLIHTAAASNLGQMLVKVCASDGIPLVNVVRRPEQVELLRGIGAEHVCDTSQPGFVDDLTEAVAATGATLGFDATGGGSLAGQLLVAMEAAAARKAATDGQAYSPYGSGVATQVYVYGRLDPAPLVVDGTLGLHWGLGGWLLGPYLARVGPDELRAMTARVGAELATTFASTFTATISLGQALDPATIRAYARPTTGAKYLIDPSLPV